MQLDDITLAGHGTNMIGTASEQKSYPYCIVWHAWQLCSLYHFCCDACFFRPSKLSCNHFRGQHTYTCMYVHLRFRASVPKITFFRLAFCMSALSAWELSQILSNLENELVYCFLSTPMTLLILLLQEH